VIRRTIGIERDRAMLFVGKDNKVLESAWHLCEGGGAANPDRQPWNIPANSTYTLVLPREKPVPKSTCKIKID
jgi:hypothetical protein